MRVRVCVYSIYYHYRGFFGSRSDDVFLGLADKTPPTHLFIRDRHHLSRSCCF